MKISHFCILLMCLLIVACSAKPESKSGDDKEQDPAVAHIEFDADSAYRNIKAQVDCGPRVPGSEGHARCAQYLVDELKRYGVDTVIEQKTIVAAFNGDKLPINNIMGQINRNVEVRVLLLAHWDTRPWADQEERKEDRTKPILGANDGGSGVGVLLEVARCLNIEKPSIGVDILFVDAEDYGKMDGWGNNDVTWCLGSQYWSKNLPYESGKRPIYGILLDMVGGHDAKFHREYSSQQMARNIVNKVWTMAAASGYGDTFVNELGGSIVDDHLFVNNAGIPCIDIIESLNPATNSFNPTWHTLDDNMKNIDRKPLKAVGQTLLNLIYQEK